MSGYESPDKLREWAANIAGPEVADRLNYAKPSIDDSAQPKSLFEAEIEYLDPNAPHYVRLASSTADYISLPSNDLPQLVADYVREIETKPSADWCKCEWIIHPDDVGKPEGQRRRRLGSVSMDCPAHTKEGFLLYFFTWVFKRDAADTEHKCAACGKVHNPPYKFACDPEEAAPTCDQADQCVMHSMCINYANCVKAERDAH